MNVYIIDWFRHVINYFHKNGLYGRVNFSRVVLSKTKLHRGSANKHVLHEWIVCLGFGVVRLYRFCLDKSDELCRLQPIWRSRLCRKWLSLWCYEFRFSYNTTEFQNVFGHPMLKCESTLKTGFQNFKNHRITNNITIPRFET